MKTIAIEITDEEYKVMEILAGTDNKTVEQDVLEMVKITVNDIIADPYYGEHWGSYDKFRKAVYHSGDERGDVNCIVYGECLCADGINYSCIASGEYSYAFPKDKVEFLDEK